MRVDFFARHFMDKVSSISFGAGNEFASCQESHDEWNDQPQAPDNYMGPTLWLADLDIFAKVNQDYPGNGKEGSHIDMLHESPLCMGIAWDPRQRLFGRSTASTATWCATTSRRTTASAGAIPPTGSCAAMST